MKTDRKEAIRQFKERKVPRGIFSLRCAASGSTWIGGSRNLEATHNGLLFMLRGGLHREKALQAEWNRYGESEFDFLVLEKLDDELPALLLTDALKERGAYWVASLSATLLL